MECLTSVGVSKGEREVRQHLNIDVEFPADCRASARSDSIKDTVDYDLVAQTVAEVCASREFMLIETVAEQIAKRTLEKFPIPEVRVLVRKVSPVPAPRVAFVSVEITRSAGSP